MTLEKKYKAKIIEEKWKDFWNEKLIFKFSENKEGDIYSVDTPPPTVSGSLHIGHIFSYTHTDIQVRYFRMKGKNIFYPMCFDDNGLPSELLTEKDLKITASKLPRHEFVEKCYLTCKKFEELYENLWRRIGLSVDWSLVYTTIEERSRRISQRSFIELLKKGKIYHKEEPVMWCPKCHTAIAQAEIEERNFDSSFINLKFKFEDGEDLIIATTRPELLSSCAAVFVHPKDRRYSDYDDREVIVPVFGHKVKIIKDDQVDMEKGTGAVMCCTFGDRQDIEWWKKHGLALKISIDDYGRMNKNSKEFDRMKIKEARVEIIKKAEEEGLIEKKINISHFVNTHERCGTPIEFLSKPQWFIKILDIKEDLIKQADKINWYPSYMKKRYVNWVENIAWDWCISRQRFYGVPIPVWFCKDCGSYITPLDKDLPIDPMKDKPEGLKCPKCNSVNFKAEEDLLDTWATSSLTPEINYKWGEKDQISNIYPMDLRAQAHDIIRTWTFYTIVKSFLHNNSIPWKNVVISGFVTIPSNDPGKVNIKGGKKTFKSEKISKSKHGEIASPLKLLEKYSADILRYWSANASPGADLQLKNIDEIEIGKKVINKIWNSFRFISMNLEEFKFEKPDNIEIIDKYIFYLMNEVIEKVTLSFDKYDFRVVRNISIDFFYKVFCDNYLEIIKDRIYNPDIRGIETKNSALWTLYKIGFTILKILAPILPYITEEIYQNLFKEQIGSISIHKCLWPIKFDMKISTEDVKAGDMFFSFLSTVREYRGEKGLSQKSDIDSAIIYVSKEENESFKTVLSDFKATTHIMKLEEKTIDKINNYYLKIL